MKGRGRIASKAVFAVVVVALTSSCGSDEPVLAPVVVADEGPTLARIDFVPGDPALSVGDSLGIEVVATDSDGMVVPGVTVEWSAAASSVASITRSGVVRANAAGNAIVQAHVRPPAGYGSSQALQRALLVSVVQPDTSSIPNPSVAELPRQKVDLTEPVTTRDVRVPAGANLQAAVNSAQRGDRLLLSPGAVYGAVALTQKPGSGWIVIQTDVELPEGRMTPAVAKSLNLAIIQGGPAVAAIGDVSHYRVQGVEIRDLPGSTLRNNLVRIDTNRSVSSALAQPRHVILDRAYVHGNPPTLQLKRCVGLSGQHVAVTNSSLLGCSKLGQDSQAIWIADGLGPTAIVNNHLQAGSEIVLSGGHDPHISGIVPSDIEIRGNYLHRPASWKNAGIGVIKNLIEIKNARRVLVEDNVFEGNWSDGQSGWSILIKSTNQDGGCQWCTADDLTIRWNLLDDAESGLQLVWGNSIGAPHGETERVVVEHNVFARLGSNGNNPGWGTPLRLTQMPKSVTIRNNTFENAGSNHFLMVDGGGGSGQDTEVSDNIGWNGKWGVWVGSGAMLADGAVHGNTIIGGTGPHCGMNQCVTTVQLQSVTLAGRSYELPAVLGKGAFLSALAERLAGVR